MKEVELLGTLTKVQTIRMAKQQKDEGCNDFSKYSVQCVCVCVCVCVCGGWTTEGREGIKGVRGLSESVKNKKGNLFFR